MTALILTNPHIPETFGAYIAEILKAEGFNTFTSSAIDDLSPALLAQHPLVLLAETALTADQACLLEAYVFSGGRLVAFRPAPRIHHLFGVRAAGEIIREGYLRIDTRTPTGRGLCAETLQFHGSADAYQLHGAEELAALLRDAETPTLYPALVVHPHGNGRAAAFAYNLPASVVLTRQGNPDWAGQERDGIPGIRAAEMFAGWNDPARSHLNQADEQMHLLAHLLEDLSPAPMPRLWYFPSNLDALVILTDDGEDSPEVDLEAHFADVEALGAQMSLYLIGTTIAPEAVARWTARGHEIATHVDDTAEALQPTAARMESVVQAAVTQHRSAYALTPRTLRNHWIVWVGWSEQAEIEERAGIRLDCNYYHYDRDSHLGRYLGEVGNFTGSGLPMKIAARDGRVLDLYQAVTQLPDEQWQERFCESFTTLLERSLDHQAYTFLNINCHTNQWQAWSRQPVLAMLATARQRGVPVWTALQALEFLTARDTAVFENLHWDGRRLRFRLHAPQPGQTLSVLLPRYSAGIILKIDSQETLYTRKMIQGREYIMVEVTTGSSQEFTFQPR